MNDLKEYYEKELFGKSWNIPFEHLTTPEIKAIENTSAFARFQLNKSGYKLKLSVISIAKSKNTLLYIFVSIVAVIYIITQIIHLYSILK
jgi:hypothetical protein